MPNTDKPVSLSSHAEEQLRYRGTNSAEIIEAIRTSTWEPAELNRLQCRKDFAYNQKWNEKVYRTKQVRPIFVEESDKIIVVTVYVYYF